MAVYTKIDKDELINFLRLYNLDELVDWKGIAEGVENSNFYIETTSKKFILTIYEKRVSKKELPFFLNLMRHLNSNLFPCPKPIYNIKGEFLNSIQGKPAALFSFLNGSSIKKPLIHNCYQVGSYLSIIHKKTLNFQMKRKNKLSTQGLKELFLKLDNRINSIDKNLLNTITEEFKFISNNWPENLPTGIIHADLFPDNVFFENNEISGVIDFYFACNDFLAYDIAIAINAWCFNSSNNLEIKKSAALLKGYQQHRLLDKIEKQQFPILMRCAALRFLLTRTYDSINQVDGALVEPKNPLEFLDKLKYIRKISSFEEYINE